MVGERKRQTEKWKERGERERKRERERERERELKKFCTVCLFFFKMMNKRFAKSSQNFHTPLKLIF